MDDGKRRQAYSAPAIKRIISNKHLSLQEKQLIFFQTLANDSVILKKKKKGRWERSDSRSNAIGAGIQTRRFSVSITTTLIGNSPDCRLRMITLALQSAGCQSNPIAWGSAGAA